MMRNLGRNFLQLLLGRACWSSDQRCSTLTLPLMSLIAAIILTQLHGGWFDSVAARAGVGLTDVQHYSSIFILPSVPRSLTSAGLPFLSFLLFYTWLSTKLLRRRRQDRFVPVALRNPACTKSL